MTEDDIRVRQAIVDDESWPAKSPTPPDDPDVSEKVEFTDFITGGLWDISDTLDPLTEQFKRQTGLE